MSNNTDIETYLNSRNLHKERFESIEQKLEIFYSEYRNKQKIIKLLDVWLYFISALRDSYGSEGLKNFFLSEFNCSNRFAMNYDLGINLNNKINPYRFKYPFHIFVNFLSRPLLPGAIVDGLFKKLRWRFAKWIVLQIPEKSDLERKTEFISYIIEYFNDSLDAELEQLIENAIPSVFYSKPIETLRKSNLIVECSPWILVDFQGLEKIFLIQRSITINGLQHGGGHNAYISEIGEDLEEELADTFYSWGLSENINQRQYRYPKRKRTSIKKINERRVLWVEKGSSTTWAKFVWPYQYQVLIEEESIKYIANELQNAKIEYYNLPHNKNQFRSNQYDGLRGEVLYSPTGSGEDLIGINDIVIFDIITSSLIHHCIEHEILFLFVVPRASREYYTPNQKEWFDMMRNVNLAFYNDEKNKMGNILAELIDSKTEMPIELRKYHNRRFII